MKLKDFLKSFDKYDLETEIMVTYKHGRCDSDIKHGLCSIEPTDHWEIFKIVKALVDCRL